MEKKMIGYKAFESDMTCRGKQYAENTVYEEPKAELCVKGMHFCENPFDVLQFYPLVTDNGELITTAEVEPQGEIKSDGTKSVTTKLRIGAKLSFVAFIKAGVEFLNKKTKEDSVTMSGNMAQIGSAGDWAKIGSSGNWAQIGSSGKWARIGSAGNEARIASAGDEAQIGSAGDWAKIGSSGKWACIASAGDEAQIGSAGDEACIASAGDAAQISSNGQNCVIVCAGHGCAVRAKAGSWITLSEWACVDGAYKPVCVKTEYVDGSHIKADTYYMLEKGKFVEA